MAGPDKARKVLVHAGSYELRATFTSAPRIPVRDPAGDLAGGAGEAVRLIGGRSVPTSAWQAGDGWRRCSRVWIPRPAVRWCKPISGRWASRICQPSRRLPRRSRRSRSSSSTEAHDAGAVAQRGLGDHRPDHRVRRAAARRRNAAPGVFEYAGDRPARWKAAEGVWLQGYWCYDWYDETIRVEVHRPAHAPDHPGRAPRLQRHAGQPVAPALPRPEPAGGAGPARRVLHRPRQRACSTSGRPPTRRSADRAVHPRRAGGGAEGRLARDAARLHRRDRPGRRDRSDAAAARNRIQACEVRNTAPAGHPGDRRDGPPGRGVRHPRHRHGRAGPRRRRPQDAHPAGHEAVNNHIWRFSGTSSPTPTASAWRAWATAPPTT